MSYDPSTNEIQNLVDELIEVYLSQAADLREYAQARTAEEGTVNLERTLRRKELRRAELHAKFEKAAFPPTAQ